MTEQPSNNNKPREAVEVIIRVADQSWGSAVIKRERVGYFIFCLYLNISMTTRPRSSMRRTIPVAFMVTESFLMLLTVCERRRGIRHRMVHDGGQDSASYGYYLKKRQRLYSFSEDFAENPADGRNRLTKDKLFAIIWIYTEGRWHGY